MAATPPILSTAPASNPLCAARPPVSIQDLRSAAFHLCLRIVPRRTPGTKGGQQGSIRIAEIQRGQTMKIGTVRWFNIEKGRGYIHPDDGGQIFLLIARR